MDVNQMFAQIIEQNKRIESGLSAWLTDDEVAKRFKVSKDTIRRWRDNKGFPFSQLEGVRRYNTKKVDAWFERHSPEAIKREMLASIKKVA